MGNVVTPSHNRLGGKMERILAVTFIVGGTLWLLAGCPGT